VEEVQPSYRRHFPFVAIELCLCVCVCVCRRANFLVHSAKIFDVSVRNQFGNRNAKKYIFILYLFQFNMIFSNNS
jgi:hypothetical protein